ncbi:MAG: GxxExxY protein [Acidobacteria bacterium]|nr:GxxExxY protein [Acidobacteriota bacterium]MYA46410.1 GxxExxY protein [Acidobacteriota bacterium]MYI40124.1 GxxExxY protein [Acidobacteriota bacterium]
MTDTEVRDVVRQIRKCARRVYRELGPGYAEAVYQKAMGIELQLRGIQYVTERNVEVVYRKRYSIGVKRIDLFVLDGIAVELKRLTGLGEKEMRQAALQAKAANALSVLVNFPDVPDASVDVCVDGRPYKKWAKR